MWSKGAWKRAVRPMPGATHLIPLYRFAKGTDARYASLWRRAVPGLFQPFATTQMDRYPTLFRFALATLGDNPSTRLLSFGCSTGEGWLFSGMGSWAAFPLYAAICSVSTPSNRR